MNLTLVPKEFEATVAVIPAARQLFFGLFKPNDWVYTEIILEVRKRTSQGLIQGKEISGVIHSNGWCGYHSLVDVDYAKHYWVEYGSCQRAVSDQWD